MDEFRKISLRDYGYLAWPFVVIVLMGLALLSVPDLWLASHFLHKVGDALIIAGALAIGVELFTLRRLVRHVADDVSFRLAGGHLPAQLRRTLWDVISSSHVREQWQKEYRLTRLAGGNVSVDVKETYRVKNYGDRPIEYSPMNADEVFWNPRATYVEYRLPNGKGFTFNERQLAEEYTTKDPNSHVPTVEGLPVVRLKPIREDPDAICTVTWHANLTMPDEYSDITSFGGPTIGLTIHLVDLPEDMTFVAGGGLTMRHVEYSRTWEFEDGFINGQHVRVWWFKKPSA